MAFATNETFLSASRSAFPRILPSLAGGGALNATLAATNPVATYQPGTPLAFNSATNKWVVWTNGGANNTGIIRGFVYPRAITTDAANDVEGVICCKGKVHHDDVVLPAGENQNNLNAALLDNGLLGFGLIIDGQAASV